MQKRIWELDALRGLCVLGMVAVHFVYDLVELYELVEWEYPAIYSFVVDWGGVLFLLISGVCVTLGRRNLRRGLIVLAGGFLCSLVTWGMYAFGFAGRGIIIYFGVLHCLGSCMLLWQPLKKLPPWLLAVLGLLLTGGGFWAEGLPRVDHFWLVPFGIRPFPFFSSDYFPLLPNAGFFLLGAFIGRTAYRNKATLLPGVNSAAPLPRFLCFCGRQSLWIYLLHQPVLSGIVYLLTLLPG